MEESTKKRIKKIVEHTKRSTIEELKTKHEQIRSILISYGNEEYGDCIIDDICLAVGIPPTTVYYVEGE